jgi:hypothetical protein
MQTIVYKTALIVGAGMGLSAALAPLFHKQRLRVALGRNSGIPHAAKSY